MKIVDINGVEITEGAEVNIFFTSSDGEFIHDCVYIAGRSPLGDIEFSFDRLLWECGGHNQYPISTEICQRYKTLGYSFNSEGDIYLQVEDCHGINRFANSKWKREDSSKYFEVMA